LVESRAQFGSYGGLKANRPYIMRAFGHWHHDDAPPPPRAVRFPASLWEATGKASTLYPLLSALQALALVAALTGRVPVIPRVPCGSGWLSRHPLTLAGVADDYVMQLREGGDGPVQCHLSMGGQQCALPTVLPACEASDT
jgi:hypothetical protein